MREDRGDLGGVLEPHSAPAAPLAAAAPASQLRPGAKFTRKRRIGAEVAVCTRRCLVACDPSSYPGELGPQDPALSGTTPGRTSPPPSASALEPTPGEVAQRRSRAGPRRREAGQSRPPPPAPDLQPLGARGPRLTVLVQPRRTWEPRTAAGASFPAFRRPESGSLGRAT